MGTKSSNLLKESSATYLFMFHAFPGTCAKRSSSVDSNRLNPKIHALFAILSAKLWPAGFCMPKSVAAQDCWGWQSPLAAGVRLFALAREATEGTFFRFCVSCGFFFENQLKRWLWTIICEPSLRKDLQVKDVDNTIGLG